ncbi:MAG: hypothetical protein Q8P24_05265, partial [Desulfobacterales bacterium]|nr:hypothetical protein [Desulfobacterales bacterium]
MCKYLLCFYVIHRYITPGRQDVTVAPMNTKLSTVGAALASFENSEIQVCYAQADYYNYHGYSL